ncbi:MAG: cation:proton antiporter [Actinomycetes bacterium]
MISVDQTSFLVIVAISALAGTATALAGKRSFIPVIVLEIVLGIIIGPQVLGLAHDDSFIDFFAELGLGMLFFFAGYEIDFKRIRGRPLKLAAVGWAMSLALAYAAGGLLASLGLVLSFLYVGSAMSTTALGTLIPILSDNGDSKTRFGTFLFGAGSIGEFGPIVLMTVLLSTATPLRGATVLLTFAGLSLAVGLVAMLGSNRGMPRISDALEQSNQAAVRISFLLVFGLVALATQLTIDALLGGFVAGIIIKLLTSRPEGPGEDSVAVVESKLRAVGYGIFIPFFFVVTGVRFDLDSLISSSSGLLKLPLFLLFFLVIRGLPALLLYRREFNLRDRIALALYSATQLPLVVAITAIAVAAGRMRPSTAAALVGAGMLSVLIFPMIAAALRSSSSDAAAESS